MFSLGTILSRPLHALGRYALHCISLLDKDYFFNFHGRWIAPHGRQRHDDSTWSGILEIDLFLWKLQLGRLVC